MRVFLTGATGYIGSAVAEALQRRGHQLIGLARSVNSAAQLEGRGLQVQRGSLFDGPAITAASAYADGVIHTALLRDGAPAEADQSAVTAILSALAGSGKPFIYTSGVWVLGNTGTRVADERTSINPVPLMAWRTEVEWQVLDADCDSVRSIVLRPGGVYGFGRGRPSMWFASAREHGVVRYVGDGENRWPMVHVSDLAELYVRALENAPCGSLLHGVSGESVRVRDAALAASEGAGIPGRVESWPLAEAREALGPYADALALDQRVSAEHTRALLNWTPRQISFLDDLRHGSYALQAVSA